MYILHVVHFLSYSFDIIIGDMKICWKKWRFNRDICISCTATLSPKQTSTEVPHQHSWTHSQQHASARESGVKDKITVRAFDELTDWLIKLLTLWWVQGWISVKYFSALWSSLPFPKLRGSEDVSFDIYVAQTVCQLSRSDVCHQIFTVHPVPQ